MRASYAAGDIRERPDTVTYEATISTWARSGREDAADRAMALLNEMEDMWKTGDGDVGPYRAAYNSALNTLYNSGTEKSARGVESLLRSMDELFRSGDDRYGDMRPDAISHTSVMDAWARCGLRVPLRRAKQILRHMRDLRDARNAAMGPDTVAYNTTLKAWDLCGEEGGSGFHGEKCQSNNANQTIQNPDMQRCITG